MSLLRLVLGAAHSIHAAGVVCALFLLGTSLVLSAVILLGAGLLLFPIPAAVA